MCKMFTNALLLLLPAVVYGGISIDIVASSELSDIKVAFHGEIKEYIDVLDHRITWTLDKVEVFSNEFEYYAQKWENLFQLPPPELCRLIANRTLVPKRFKILETLAEDPEIVDTNHFYNNSTEPSFLEKGIPKVSSTWTVSNSWPENRELESDGPPISYSVNMTDKIFKTKSHIDYKSKLGENSWQSKNITVNPINNKLRISVQPGEEVVTSLILQRVTIPVQVSYVASLEGNVICNEPWPSININDFLIFNRLPRTLYSTEIIRISFISNVLHSTSVSKIQDISSNFSEVV